MVRVSAIPVENVTLGRLWTTPTGLNVENLALGGKKITVEYVVGTVTEL